MKRSEIIRRMIKAKEEAMAIMKKEIERLNRELNEIRDGGKLDEES